MSVNFDVLCTVFKSFHSACKCLQIHKQCGRLPFNQHPQGLLLSFEFDKEHSFWSKIQSQCCLNFHLHNFQRCFAMYLMTIGIYFWEMSVHFNCIFLMRLLFWWILFLFFRFLYVLDISPVSEEKLAIFSILCTAYSIFGLCRRFLILHGPIPWLWVLFLQRFWLC